MKANSVGLGVNIPTVQLNFRSDTVHAPQNGHDEFVRSEKPSSKKKTGWIVAGLIALGAGAIIAHKSGWFKKATDKVITSGDVKFKNIDEAKKYFENIGVETDFRGANETHLPMLNRIKDQIKQLKEMGVKKEKPDSITISDWKNREETKELFQKHGSLNEEPPESGYYKAFSLYGKGNTEEAHILIDSNASFDQFRHEMGHINHHRGLDSYWHSKGIKGYDFANKQLEILGSEEKIYPKINGLYGRNLIEFPVDGTSTKFRFATENGEIRYIYPQNIIDKMQQETRAYDNGKTLTEQIAYIFEGLLKGDKFSDEAMLYYDFAGGARIPNLKIDGKTYDEYIETLYNNKDLIEKLRQNVKISKI